ncbi:hypothetical protein K2173_006760 [Erythroxylum novogranatense]|uniref:CTLH domain-containing protein n=1 Tax=Erythroxylum novogranatense TaxID=1862640 RepID=A0AAV8SZ18_9ROSI|nr:hypothetical protein K2173_006760 [Erythroxylum novogranatense]
MKKREESSRIATTKGKTAKLFLPFGPKNLPTIHGHCLNLSSIKIVPITKSLSSIGFLFPIGNSSISRYLSGGGFENSIAPIQVEIVGTASDGREWEECVGTLSTTDLWDGETIKLATFLLLEQKFLDLLKMVKVNDTMRTVREEIVPLGVNMTRVSELSSCLIAHPERLISGQDVGGANSRLQIVEKLKNLLPPSILVPGKILEHLLEMTFYVQPNYCRFHNIPNSNMSLCSDYQCGRNYILSETLQDLFKKPPKRSDSLLLFTAIRTLKGLVENHQARINLSATFLKECSFLRTGDPSTKKYRYQEYCGIDKYYIARKKPSQVDAPIFSHELKLMGEANSSIFSQSVI